MKNLFKITFLMLIVSMAFSCKNKSGEAAKVADKVENSTKVEGTEYTVDASSSQVMWDGTKPTGGGHNGTVNVTEGKVIVDKGAVVGGSFTLDMNTITVSDLEGDQKGYLESHLKGLGDDKKADDFFNVNKFPTAKYEITKVTSKEGDPNANALVYGNLTIRDNTKSVSFSANINVTDDKVEVGTVAFTINRTEWGIKYNSPSFFENLKEYAINDDVGLKISLVANK